MWLKLFRNTFILIVWCQIERSLTHTHNACSLIQLKPHWKRNVIVIRFKRDNLHHIKAFVGQINVCAVLLDFNLHSSKSHLKLLNVYTHIWALNWSNEEFLCCFLHLLPLPAPSLSPPLIRSCLLFPLFSSRFFATIYLIWRGQMQPTWQHQQRWRQQPKMSGFNIIWIYVYSFSTVCVCVYTNNAIERYVKYAIIKLAPWKFNSMLTMWNNGTDIANIYILDLHWIRQWVQFMFGKFFLLLLLPALRIYRNTTHTRTAHTNSAG